MDIAVVLPVYNGENSLEACIKSINAAGSRISEIIIVDDGSTDGTLSKARALAAGDHKIHVISKANNGCYMARRTGIEAATARYIAFIDADDAYIAGSLDMLAELLEENDADVAVGAYKEVMTWEGMDCSFAETAPVITTCTAEQMWQRIMKWKTQEFVNYVWNKLYKRELLIDLIEADGINQGEDVLLTCQAFLGVKKIVETTKSVYLYYHNPESLTRVGFGDGDLNLIRVWDNIVSIMKEKRSDLLPMAQFNRWRTDFTLITRLILIDDKESDKKYSGELKKWRSSLKEHWKDLLSPHAMPRNREILVLGLRFFYGPTKLFLRLGRKLSKKETSVILHSGDKR